MGKSDSIIQLLLAFDQRISWTSVESVVDASLEFFEKQFPCDRVSLSLFNMEEQCLDIYTKDETPGLNNGSKIPATQAQLKTLLATKEPQYQADVRAVEAPNQVQEILIKAGFRAGLIVPLILADTVLGSVNYDSYTVDGFDQEVRETLGLFSARLTLALHHAQLHENLQQKEATLKLREKEYRDLIEQAGDAIIKGLPNGSITQANRAACILTGYTNKELTSLKISALFTSEVLERQPLRYDLVDQGLSVISERDLITKQGNVIRIEMNSKKLDSGELVSIIRDLSERLETQKDLLDREARLLEAQEIARLGGWQYDFGLDNFFPSEKFLSLLHLDTDKVSGSLSKLSRLVHPDDRKAFELSLAESRLTRKPLSATVRIRVDRGDVWLNFRGRFHTLEDTQNQLMVGTVQDVSDLHLAQQALRISEARYHQQFQLLRSISDNTPNLVWAEDKEGRFTFVNKEFCRLVLKASNTSEPVGSTFEAFLARRPKKNAIPDLVRKLLKLEEQPLDDTCLEQVEISGLLDGQAMTLSVSLSLLSDARRNPVGRIFSANDISLQKKQQAELENRNNQIKALLDAVPAPIYAKDIKGRYVLLNDAYLEFFGRERKEMLGRTVSECWDEEKARRFEHDDRLLLTENKIQTSSVTLNSVTGPRQTMVHKARYYDSDGKVAGLIGTIWDYSDLKAAEERYHNLFELSPIPVVVHDGVHFLAVNQAALDFYGSPDPETDLKRPLVDFIHPDYVEPGAKRIEKVLGQTETEEAVEAIYYNARGEPRHVVTTAVAIQFEGKPAVMNTFRDITAEKENQALLKTSEENHRNLIEANPNPVFVHVDMHVVYANRAALDFSGKTSLSELIDVKVSEFVHPDYRDASIEFYRHIKETGEPTSFGEQVYVRGDGEPRHVEAKGVPITFDGVPSVLISFVDTTDKALVRKALDESRLQLELVTDHITQFIILTSYDLKFLYCNTSCAKFLNTDKASLVGSAAKDYITPDALALVEERIPYLKKGQIARFTYTHTHSDGHIADYLTTLIPVKDSQGVSSAFLAQVEDVTARNTASRELAENKELLELIIDTIPALITYVDTAQKYLFVNQAYADWLKSTKTDLIGRSLEEVLDQEAMREIVPHLKGVIRGEEQNFTRTVFHKEGGYHIFENTYIPRRDRHGNIKAFLTVLQDITEQRQVQVVQDALRKLAYDLTVPLDVHTIGATSARAIREVFQSDAIAIELFDNERRLNLGIYSEDTFEGSDQPVEVEAVDIPYDDLSPELHDAFWEPTCTNRSDEDLKRRRKTVSFGNHKPSRSLLNVPIRWEGNAVGVISAQSYTYKKYSEADIPTLQTFGDLIGGAMIRARQDARLLAHQKALEKEEEKYRAILDNAGDAVFVISTAGEFLIYNERCAEELGYSMDEMATLSIQTIDPEFFAFFDVKKLPAMRKQGRSENLTSSYLRKDGSTFPVELRISSTEVNNETCILCFARDITDRKRSELRDRALRDLAHKLNESKDMFTVGRLAAFAIRSFFESDAFAIEYYDYAEEKIVGVYSEDRLADGQDPLEIPPRDTPFGAVRPDFFKLNEVPHVRNRSPEELAAISNTRAFGSDRLSHSLLFAPLTWEKRIIGVLTVQSYTDYKYSDQDLGNIQLFADQIGGALMRAKANASLLVQTNALLKSERELTSLLKEKDVLLKEVYHRTKNNMQVIVGLLDMQSYKTRNKQTFSVLSEMKDRISSMSLVHDLLYRSKNLADIKLDTYLERLVSQLILAYNASGSVVDHVIKSEPVPINIQAAVPLGLVINEIVTNALKYAFPDQRDGTFKIHATARDGNGLLMKLNDDGVGMDVDFDIRKSDSLGMRIIHDIVTLQLHGKVTLDTQSGVSYEIEIPDLLLGNKPAG